MTLLLGTTFVDITAFMVRRSSTFSAITATTMTALVNQIVYASPTVETTRCYKLVIFALAKSSCLLHLSYVARANVLVFMGSCIWIVWMLFHDLFLLFVSF